MYILFWLVSEKNKFEENRNALKNGNDQGNDDKVDDSNSMITDSIDEAKVDEEAT